MKTSDEWEVELGRQVRALRVARGWPQLEVAKRANVSANAMRALERGEGSTVRTLARVAGALGREDWLGSLDPIGDLPSPIEELRIRRGQRPRRQRVRESGS